jgi:hypothetical protein
VVELAAASLALAHSRPTAPEAIASLRSAPAHLLAAARQAQQQGSIAGRFLSISDITFDPGDLAELQAIFAGLPQEAVYDLVVASKLQEIVAPNLSLLWGLPAVDGYDGGVLPLRRYVDLQALLTPGEELDPDGRLREQLSLVPPSRLLRLLNVEHVITDKQSDLWRDGVYFDLELSTRLEPGQEVMLQGVDRLEATHLALFSHLEGAAALEDGQVVGAVDVVDGAGARSQLALRAGQSTAEGHWTEAVQHGQPADRQPWPGSLAAGSDYLARLQLAQPGTPLTITVRNTSGDATLVLRGATLVDERTATHAALTMPADGAFRRVHSGDVKIYQNLESLPRAYLVNQALLAEDDDAALALLSAPDFDPARAVVLLRDEWTGPPPAGGDLAANGTIAVRRYEPEMVEMVVQTEQPAVLVLSDTWYPGWTATVDGEPAPILRANTLFRALALEAGRHEVVLRFQPQSLRTGALISAVALLVALIWLVAALRARKKSSVSFSREAGIIKP